MKGIGSFEIKSGNVMISDPCYKLGTWCQGKIKNVKKGLWQAEVKQSDEGDFGNRIAELIASHSNTGATTEWKKTRLEVGVDSGQAGIFDLKEYHGGEDEYGEGGWYDKCCHETLKKENGHQISSAGVIKGGVVSSSGFGDGGYDCFIKRRRDSRNRAGKIVAIKIVFISRKED